MKEGILIRIDFLIDLVIQEIDDANKESFKTHEYIKY